MTGRDFSSDELAAIRADFPILKREGRGQGQPIAYLDASATSQKPQVVIDTVDSFYRLHNGAVHRGTHLLADESTQIYEDARQTVADFIGADSDEIVWTKNATEGINVLAYGIMAATMAGRDYEGKTHSPLVLRSGANIVVTKAEHHANLVPWQLLCQRLGVQLRWIDLDEVGAFDESTFDVIDADTAIVAFTHVSNVTGTISPVEAVVAKARGVGALVVLDTCQSSAHMPLDVRHLDCDAAILSSHKMCGPTGIGALYLKRDILAKMPPVISGGDMIADVDMDTSTYQDGPVRLEAGSQPVAQIAGWKAALDYLRNIGMDRIEAHERAITAYALDKIVPIDGLRIIGSKNATDRIGVISFDMPGIHPHDVGQFVDNDDVAIRVGHHCALPLHKHFGIRASSRMSASLFTTTQDIDRLVHALIETRKFFHRM